MVAFETSAFEVVRLTLNRLLAVASVIVALAEVKAVLMMFSAVTLDAAKLVTWIEPAVKDPAMLASPPMYKLPEADAPPCRISEPVVSPVESVVFNTTIDWL